MNYFPKPISIHYFNRYLKLIDHYKNIKFNCYVEKHHILPKSMGGDNYNQNIIKLPARLHYIAHYLLYKAYKTHKMTLAFMMMHVVNTRQERGHINSKLYETARITHSKLLSGVMQGKVRVKNKKGEILFCDKNDIPEGYTYIQSDELIRRKIRYSLLKYYEDNGKKIVLYNTNDKTFFERNFNLFLLENNIEKLPNNIVKVFNIKRGESYKYVYNLETGKRRFCNIFVDVDPPFYSLNKIDKMAYKGKYNLSGNELLSRSVRVTGELNPTKREDVKAKMSNTKQNNIVKKCPYCSVESKNYSNLTRYHFDNCKSKP